MAFRIRYNSPVILSFSLLAILILVLDSTVLPNLAIRYFAVGTRLDWGSVADWFRLFSHVLGHANWAHLAGNLTFILLLGPILEEKYGSGGMLFMVLVCALVTGLVNVAISNTGLMGASGVAFMLIVLVSIVDIRARQIPLTFVLVVVVFLGQELLNSFRDDDVSQMAHLVGGVVGAALGFAARRGTLPVGPLA